VENGEDTMTAVVAAAAARTVLLSSTMRQIAPLFGFFEIAVSWAARKSKQTCKTDSKPESRCR